MTLARRRLARREFVLLPAVTLTGCAVRGPASVNAAQTATPAPPVTSAASASAMTSATSTVSATSLTSIKLPRPRTSGGVALAKALARRRSVRTFTTKALTLAEVGQLMWAGQGVTHEGVKRAAPSPKALYPLQLYALSASRTLRYQPVDHRVIQQKPHLPWRYLVESTPNTGVIEQAPTVFALTGTLGPVTAQVGDLGHALVDMEAGHAAENILLQAVALGLGAIPLGLFTRDRLAQYLAVPSSEEVLYLIAVGHPA